MFDEVLVKIIFPIIGSVASAAFIALVIWFWKIPRQLDKHTEVLQKLVGTVDSNSDRIEVHDKLATSVFSKPISSKLLAEGKQPYPIFYQQKPRKDH